MSECCPNSPPPPGRINASKQCAVTGAAQCQNQLYPVKVRVNIFPHATKWDKSGNAGSAGARDVLTVYGEEALASDYALRLSHGNVTGSNEPICVGNDV